MRETVRRLKVVILQRSPIDLCSIDHDAGPPRRRDKAGRRTSVLLSDMSARHFIHHANGVRAFYLAVA
jgi:hypothetical protein